MIDIQLTPKKVNIKSIIEKNRNGKPKYSRSIYLEGIPEYSSNIYFLDLLNGDKKIKKPRNFTLLISANKNDYEYFNNVRIPPCSETGEIGALHYMPATSCWGEPGTKSTPVTFHANIKVSKVQFKNLIDLIQSRKAKLVFTITFWGRSPNDAIGRDESGHFMTWDISRSDSAYIDNFYFDILYRNEITTLNTMLSKKLAAIEDAIHELKNKKISIF